MTDAEIRQGMPPVKLSLQRKLDAIVGAAWDAHSRSRKAPRKAGVGLRDPNPK
ncbi:hypothetical protein [Bradyrhizobium sp. 199]|uniref:hypothetical protein n=1 Tax=Bradyrhizobium sp. 199 TaxID=2782664 RepID=UPI001FFA1C4A|nr:hypothetical protein [Bradyrhizobium sp. 199]